MRLTASMTSSNSVRHPQPTRDKRNRDFRPYGNAHWPASRRKQLASQHDVAVGKMYELRVLRPQLKKKSATRFFRRETAIDRDFLCWQIFLFKQNHGTQSKYSGFPGATRCKNDPLFARSSQAAGVKEGEVAFACFSLGAILFMWKLCCTFTEGPTMIMLSN